MYEKSKWNVKEIKGLKSIKIKAQEYLEPNRTSIIDKKAVNYFRKKAPS